MITDLCAKRWIPRLACEHCDVTVGLADTLPQGVTGFRARKVIQRAQAESLHGIWAPESLAPDTCAARGADYLFSLYPAWTPRIDLSTLNIRNGASCALAQVHSIGEISWEIHAFSAAWLEAFGFMPRSLGDGWRGDNNDELVAAWRQELGPRLAPKS